MGTAKIGIAFTVLLALVAVVALIVVSLDDEGLTVDTVSNECTEGCTLVDGEFVILDVLPHDTSAFTQGLLFYDGFLYESTGREGVSDVRQVNIRTGEVLKSFKTNDSGEDLPLGSYFGEGLTLYREEILMQITWQERTCFLYDLENLEPHNSPNNYFQFESTANEGWGIVIHPETQQVLLSDGSSYIHFYDIIESDGIFSFNLVKRVEIINPETNTPIIRINELEFIFFEGKWLLFMNVWQTPYIYAVDIDTGFAVRRYDFREANLPFDLLPAENVLNGIAWDANTTESYVTGKLWRNMMRLQFL